MFREDSYFVWKTEVCVMQIKQEYPLFVDQKINEWTLPFSVQFPLFNFWLVLTCLFLYNLQDK